MLDPPISQADIDERTVFVRRDGVEVVITEPRDRDYKPEWKWFDKFGVAYTDDGFYFPSKSQTAADLIARKPKESEMSQVVVEDKRIRPLESPIVSFGKLKDESVFVCKDGPQVVCVKFGGNRLSFNGTYVAVYSTDDICQCIPRPDLRLRLVLETI